MRMALVCLCASSALAGPWTKGPGEAYLKLSGDLYSADATFEPDGTKVQTDYLGVTSALYAEVGLGADLQALLYLPHRVARNQRPDGDRFLSASGGDARVGLQYGLPLPFPVSASLTAKVPLYDVNEPGGFEHGAFPAAGDGQLDFDLKLAAGHTFGRLGVQLEAGHRFRTETYVGEGTGLSYVDALLGSAELSVRAFARVWVALRGEVVLPYSEDGRSKGGVSLGPKIYAPVWKGVALEADGGFEAWTRHASEGLRAALGVSYNL